MSDEELLRRADELAVAIRGKTCDLIESLAEIDRRKLYRGMEYRSLFEYCLCRLGMTEAATYRRIRAARAIQLFPWAGQHLRAGKLSLESLVLLNPHLNDPDAGRLLQASVGLRVSEVEKLIAGRRTEEPRRDVVRMVATSVARPPAEEAPAPMKEPLFELAAPPPVPIQLPDMTAPLDVSPSASESQDIPPSARPSPDVSRPDPPPPRATHAVRIAFTADESFHVLLREVQMAMRHKYPDGRLDGIFRDALQALLKKKRPWAFPKASRA